jgi:hypothetical protein
MVMAGEERAIGETLVEKGCIAVGAGGCGAVQPSNKINPVRE